MLSGRSDTDLVDVTASVTPPEGDGGRIQRERSCHFQHVRC